MPLVGRETCLQILPSPGCLLNIAVFTILLLCFCVPPVNGCTAIVVGHQATSDGAGYTSSTSDCLDCDFRLAKVPLRERGSNPVSRPVFLYRTQYPHVVQEGRADTWRKENLEGSERQINAWSDFASKPIGYVPEVEKTYALLETGSGYGIVNEKMVAMSESTCIAKFVAKPVNNGGHALFDVGELSRIALERSASARDAIKLMGSMAEQYGYYGAEWDTSIKYDEAGENLMVSDPKEAWVFHILPDDTGKSAIWAAQRVPDDHITVVANQFIIRRVNSSDTRNFMHSSNMFAVAEMHGLYDRARDGPLLDFTKAFSAVRPHSSYSTHRVYRVFTLANPDLVGKLDPYPSVLMDGYPFSVKPKRNLTVHDLFRINRDHYQDSPWDMTTSTPAQPFGDPDRYDTGPVGNMSLQEVTAAGEFSRAISIGRTSYTAIARSAGALPEQVGAMVYFAQQQPDSSVFIPVYVAAEKLPTALTVGSLLRFNQHSMFWAVAAVSNWIHKYYLHAIGDLRPVQQSFEKQFAVDSVEAEALALLKNGKPEQVAQLLTNFTTRATETALHMYKELFPRLMARFHDGFTMEDPDALTVNMTTMFYSAEWLRMVGYFRATETGGGDLAVASIGQKRPFPGKPVSASSDSELFGQSDLYKRVLDSRHGPQIVLTSFLTGLFFGVIFTFAATWIFGVVRRKDRRAGYAPI